MEGQEVKTPQQQVRYLGGPPAEALNELAETKAGVIFLTWLKNRCFFDHSTVSGNAETYEVNTLGTIAQEFQRRIYLDIRRNIKSELRKKIEQ